MPDKIQKFIDSLDNKFRMLLKKKLIELRKDPYKVRGVIKMKGHADMYRMRIGKVRIVYSISNGNKVEIIDIDFRENIY